MTDFAHWLNEFCERRGRPLRVLHIGNIANNAYTNATIQRRYGIEADVICCDYYHVMSCPEWADHQFEGAVDPNLPNWWATTLGGWKRPSWFAQGPMSLCIKYLVAHRCGRKRDAERLWAKLQRHYRSLFRPFWIPEHLQHVAAAVRARASIRRYDVPLTRQVSLRGTIAVAVVRTACQLCRGIHRLVPRILSSGIQPVAVTGLDETRCEELLERFERIYSEELPNVDAATRRADITYAKAMSFDWQTLFQQYDIVQAYAIDGYIPLYNAFPHYCAYEHGTLRTLPFEMTQAGRLCRLAYRCAEAVFVTNVDVLPSVGKLSLDPSKVVCLPHACDDQDILAVARRNSASRPRADGVITFFAPARHHWSSGGPSWEKGNDRIIRAAAMLRKEGARIEVIAIEWGQEVAKSKQLIAQLGCAEIFRWVQPMHKRELWKAFLEAHCIVNQFRVPAIGGIDFEALILGCRLITWVDPAAMKQFFGAAPPILSASSVDEIAEQMRRVVSDPADTEAIGTGGREWGRLYHSTERVMSLQVDAYKRMLRSELPGPEPFASPRESRPCAD